jgi:hypothetical protein
MNFSQYLNLIENPVYKAKKKKAKVKDQKNPPEDYEGYQVWGSNGMDGGYAIEERPVKEEMIMELSREERERDERRRKEAEKYKKKPPKPADLAKGEVRTFDKTTGEWKSNVSSEHPRSKPLRKGEFRRFNKDSGSWESNRD